MIAHLVLVLRLTGWRRGYRRLVAPPGIVTIGVYDWDVDSFVGALHAARVLTVWDVRQRRGVRGPQYAWANAGRLVPRLEREGFRYEHHRELAPTTELRRLQYAEDERQGVGKRSRRRLAPGYVRGYLEEVLAPVDLDALAARLSGAGPTALLCVEQEPAACHRSLLAARLADAARCAVLDLVPGT